MLVKTNNTTVTSDYIISNYDYQTCLVDDKREQGLTDCNEVPIQVTSVNHRLCFKIKKHVPKVGLLLVGLTGNNGTTVVGGLIANKKKMCWNTRNGIQSSNFFGSMVLSSQVNIGYNPKLNKFCHVPISSIVPLLDPTNLVIGGWDINGVSMGDALKEAHVFDYDLTRQLYDEMQQMVPYPGIYIESFIASNQKERATNILKGSLLDQLNAVRGHIKDFKSKNGLNEVIVVWTATTERFTEIQKGVHDTYDHLYKAIEQNNTEISPSTLYAVASILEGCSYINGSPQNTFIPAVIELSETKNVFIAGDDFKTGQTKLKSVLTDFLISAGIKPLSIVSYNHLGNNDGKNLASPSQFKSKEISKSNVIDDMVESNQILYEKNEHPAHCVVIKYVPPVGDSKRAMDEYYSDIFMGGKNTIVIHNTCEDSLLAAPIILDLVLLTEFCQRVSVQVESENQNQFQKLHPILSLLSYFCKAPIVPENTPVVNALNSQKLCITNFVRACVGLPPENNMFLENKIPSMLKYIQH